MLTISFAIRKAGLTTFVDRWFRKGKTENSCQWQDLKWCSKARFRDPARSIINRKLEVVIIFPKSVDWFLTTARPRESIGDKRAPVVIEITRDLARCD